METDGGPKVHCIRWESEFPPMTRCGLAKLRWPLFIITLFYYYYNIIFKSGIIFLQNVFCNFKQTFKQVKL